MRGNLYTQLGTKLLKSDSSIYSSHNYIDTMRTNIYNSLGTKLKYFQVKNFDTTALSQDYQRYLSVAKANDKGAPNLSFAPYPAKVLIGYANIPDTGYGS